METVTISRPRMTADLLLWQRYGIAGQNLVADMLNLNPGLSDMGAVIPLGTVVVIPPAPQAESAQAPRRVLSLFGE